MNADAHVGGREDLRFPELAQHSVYRVECSVDLLSDLGRSQDERQHLIQTNGMRITEHPEAVIQQKDDLTLAPVSTILPETKINSTTLGLIMR